MDKSIVDILADVIAQRDGFAGWDAPPSYYTEAREIIEALYRRGLDVVRVPAKVDG